MRKQTDIIKIVLSVSFIIISTFLINTGYKNLYRNSEIKLKYNNLNEVLKEKISENKEKTNEYISKTNAIREKTKNMKLKASEYDKLKLNDDGNILNDLLISSVDGNLDVDRKNSIRENSVRYRKLRSTYFADDEVASIDEACTNILIADMEMNNYIYSFLNRKIVAHNNNVFENEGVYNYFNNTKNYLIKMEIVERLSKTKMNFEELKNEADEILYFKEKNKNLFDAMLFPSGNNYNYLINLKNQVGNEKIVVKYEKPKSIKEELQSMEIMPNNSMVFGFDTFSQNIDYMYDYDIIDKTFETDEGIEVLRYLLDKRGRLYLAEVRKDGKPEAMIYYGADGNPFSYTDMKNFTIYDFTNNSLKDSKLKYEEAEKVGKLVVRN